jgi:hypothetical protein
VRDFDYRGMAALVIACCAAFGVFVVVPIAVLRGMSLSEIGSQVMVALGGALVGAFSVYMGMRNGDKP